MYLNLIQLAESFGVSEKVVEDWIRNEGLPHLPDRGRLLFDRARVVTWAAGRGLTARAGFLAPENAAFATGFGLGPMLRAGGIWRDLAAAEVIDVLARVLGALPAAPQPVRRLLAQRLRVAGGINWAPVGGGFGLPHFSTRIALGRDAGVISLLLLRDALPLAEPPADGVAVTRMFFFVPPSPRAHLEMLGRLSRALSKGPLRGLVEAGASDEAIIGAVGAGDEPGALSKREGSS